MEKKKINNGGNMQGYFPRLQLFVDLGFPEQRSLYLSFQLIFSVYLSSRFLTHVLPLFLCFSPTDISFYFQVLSLANTTDLDTEQTCSLYFMNSNSYKKHQEEKPSEVSAKATMLVDLIGFHFFLFIYMYNPG